MSRIEAKFADLKSKKESAFVTFLMAGDPTIKESHTIFKKLPKLGVDIIEIGMPFTDPMADGILIQKAGQRSLSNETNLNNIFDLVKEIRKEDNKIPIILMGYYNPIYSMGVNKFLNQSHVKIGEYNLDLNSRKISFRNKSLNLTERETNLIIFIKDKKNVTIKELQKKVWDYSPDLDTHTVETHIYRLRKKMKETFGNESFILNTSNGYSID